MASYILEKTHEAVRSVVKHGDVVVDATVGNGWDTLFLARLVGPTGRVIGFDIQRVAIDITRRRLAAEDLLERCAFFERSHEDAAESLAALGVGKPTAVMFNLGYLPGGDRSIMTLADTTIESLKGMLDVLATGGILTIVAYRGHPGAEEECQAVEAWTSELERPAFGAVRIIDPTGPDHAPVLFVVRRRATPTARPT